LKITAEQKVLFKTLKGDSSIELGDANPDRLFNLFQRHRLFSETYNILQLLDEQNRVKWEKTIRTLTIRSLRHTSVLGSLVESYEKEGIKAIPLKGPLLAHSLYGNIGSRHFVDLDILIRGVEIERIIGIAEASGFSLKFPSPGLSLRQWDYYFKYKKDIGMYNKESGVFLELHTGIDSHKLISIDKGELLWKDLIEENIGGSRIWSMNNENNFLYLAFHGGIHRYARLFWLRDVAEAITRWKLNHELILENAKLLGIERLLGVSLELASQYFNVPIPEQYALYLEKDKKIISKLKNHCNSRILSHENLSVTGDLRKYHFLLELKSGIKHKCSVVTGIFNRWYIEKYLGGH
jgi:hypothetical protein